MVTQKQQRNLKMPTTKNLEDALELLAVATFFSPELKAKRSDVLTRGLKTLNNMKKLDDIIDGCLYVKGQQDMRDRLAQEFDCRAVLDDNLPSPGWYEPHEPAEIIRAMPIQSLK